mgnify:CR=1 FL=1
MIHEVLRRRVLGGRVREAERVRNLPDRWDNRDRWVGLFRVRYAHTDQNNAVYLVTNNTYLFGEAGFVQEETDEESVEGEGVDEGTGAHAAGARET